MRVLVGREAEFSVAGGVLERAAGGGCCVVLSGEAGIGKAARWEHVPADAGSGGSSSGPAGPRDRRRGSRTAG